MIGPSAPNGPPVPIAIAAEIGFRIATFGSIRLRLVSTASIASGIPCPLIFDDPYFAITPTISPPITGTRITHGPRCVKPHTRERRRPPMKEKQIGEQPDQLVERVSHQPRDQPNPRRQKRHQHNPKLRRLRKGRQGNRGPFPRVPIPICCLAIVHSVLKHRLPQNLACRPRPRCNPTRKPSPRQPRLSATIATTNASPTVEERPFQGRVRAPQSMRALAPVVALPQLSSPSDPFRPVSPGITRRNAATKLGAALRNSS